MKLVVWAGLFGFGPYAIMLSIAHVDSLVQLIVGTIIACTQFVAVFAIWRIAQNAAIKALARTNEQIGNVLNEIERKSQPDSI